MANRSAVRKPKQGAETAALDLWRQALPHNALVTLAESGCVWVDRVGFLREVVGLSASDAIEFVDRFTPDQWSAQPAEA